MNEQPVVRPATLRDLAALEQLERTGFSREDRFSRQQLRYLVGRANSTTLVLEFGGQIVAAAIILWRRDSPVGRLYSLVTNPSFQGRGFGSRLLRVCEDAAARRGCTHLKLEVRPDNTLAVNLYLRRGYQICRSIPNFYGDGAPAHQMIKELVERGVPEVNLEVPYYAQTLEFTCGPACLMMAMKHFDLSLALNRSLELMLWKEATLIFMTSGLGGCDAFGLAVAARRRGYPVRVILSNQNTPFLSSVRSGEKKEVIGLVHQQLKAEAEAMGVDSEYYNFGFEDIAAAMRGGQVPIVLISTYRLHRIKAPHWVVVTGFDRKNVYFHDPYEGFYLEDKAQAQHLRISISEFRRMRRYGKDLQKSVIFVAPPE